MPEIGIDQTTTTVELNRIRKKWQHERTDTATDIQFLLAEVDRLKAENEKLKDEFVPLS